MSEEYLSGSSSEVDAAKARALARDYRALLVVLHVATPPPDVTPGEFQQEIQRAGYLAELEGRLRQAYAADSPAGELVALS